MSFSIIYECPTKEYSQCSWEGAAEDILEHFIEEHEHLLMYSSEVYIDLLTLPENRLLFLNEEIYLIQLKICDDFLKIGLRFLGPSNIAKNMTYDIVLRVDEKSYFTNFSDDRSILNVIDGFWNVNLDSLRNIHGDFNEIQCNFSISCLKIEENEEKCEDESDIRDESEIRDESADLPENDNVSLNFTILEVEPKVRRFSSLIGIPQELFAEKEKTDLSCSNCFMNMLPPIYFCVKNHNVCADCRFESCKICYGAVTENRNKDLEDYSRKCLHLCRFHAEGCMESFMYNEIRAHEMKCIFCTYKCPGDCQFNGKFFEFSSHFRIKHPSWKVHYKTPVDFPGNSKFFIYDNALGIFFCTSTISTNSIRWIVFFVGPKDRSFSCELTFKGGKSNSALVLKRLENQYSIAQTRENLKKMRVKEKHACLIIKKSYF